MNKVKNNIDNCLDCKHHDIQPDPDPLDSFCYDDVKVVCKLCDKNVTYSCRPYRVRKESEIPDWCPLIKEENMTEKISNDKFMKILIACGVEYDQLKDWTWEIEVLGPHKYHCIGCHPVAARIDIIKDYIVV